MGDQSLRTFEYCMLMVILLLFGFMVGLVVRDEMYKSAASEGTISPRIIVVPGENEKSELNEIKEFDSISC